MQTENKANIEHHDIEQARSHGNEYEAEEIKALENERVELTEEDVSVPSTWPSEVLLNTAQDRRIRRKTDKRILAILCWIYFLQIFDKVVFGLGNVFGLSEDLKLTGAQYR